MLWSNYSSSVDRRKKEMSSKNLCSGYALKISLVTIAFITVLISVNCGAGASPQFIYPDNNSSYQTGIARQWQAQKKNRT